MAEKKKRKKTHIATDTLTQKQEDFCRDYVRVGNATEAYRLHYNTEKMTWQSIRTSANELLHNPKITRRIQEIQVEEAENSRIDRSKVEKILLDIISCDPSDIYIVDEKTGKIKAKSPSQLPKRVRNAIAHITNNRGVIRYDFNGKTEAARLLGAWNGWNAPTQVEIGGSIKGELKIGFDEEE